jgi:hypothetical protein
MIKFRTYQDTYEELYERTLLITTDDAALNGVLADLKKKMYNDIRHNKLNFINQIAKHVKQRLNKDKQAKGKVAVENI